MFYQWIKEIKIDLRNKNQTHSYKIDLLTSNDDIILSNCVKVTSTA